MSTRSTNKDNILDRPVEVVVLAAGQGKRMRSAVPKVLHPISGRPMLELVLETTRSLRPKRVHVVIGHQSEEVKKVLGQNASNRDLNWVVQQERKGTAHAVAQTLPFLSDDAVVVVTYGDVPLVRSQTLRECADLAAEGGIAIITATFQDPAELGRIVRDASGSICSIVEYADADGSQRKIREINSGIVAVSGGVLRSLISEIEPHNAQGEYYLTDMVEIAVRKGIPVCGLVCEDPTEVIGINDRAQLAQVERIMQRRIATRLMADGVTIADPERLDVRGNVTAGEDCFIDVNVVLSGSVRMGRGVRIGPGCVIANSELGDGVVIHAHTVVDGMKAANGCELGPFARIRPGTELAEAVKIGNFVEAKKAKIGRGSKASHLTYLGDATLGEGCNVGAGTVTCNYDGVDKHQTTIGDRVFVGTNSTLVAPLEIGSDSYVAAGSTITSKVDDENLAIGRSRQRNITGWTRPDRRERKNESTE